MPTYPCPRGHDSTDADFCSVCGAKVQPAIVNVQVCPDCGAKREASGGTFCEICGFNFTTGAHGELKPVPPIPAAPAGSPRWELGISVDPALRAPDSPEPPGDFEPRTMPVDHESNLIGRRSERRVIDPEISLDHDDAVSHRHALLTRSSEGALTLRDLGSANGTVLNGTVLAPLTDAPLKDGDEFTLGHWTRVAIRAAS